MCPECNGLGRRMGVDMDMFMDTSKSLDEGAILFPDFAITSWDWSICTQSRLFDNDKKLADYTDEEKCETDACRSRAFLFDPYSRCCAIA